MPPAPAPFFPGAPPPPPAAMVPPALGPPSFDQIYDYCMVRIVYSLLSLCVHDDTL